MVLDKVYTVRQTDTHTDIKIARVWWTSKPFQGPVENLYWSLKRLLRMIKHETHPFWQDTHLRQSGTTIPKPGSQNWINISSVPLISFLYAHFTQQHYNYHQRTLFLLCTGHEVWLHSTIRIYVLSILQGRGSGKVKCNKQEIYWLTIAIGIIRNLYW